MKKKQFEILINQMSTCQKCESIINKNGKDCSLINPFKDERFCYNIPSMWTDWIHHLNASIMIVGQDWGPYKDMQKLNEDYIKNPTPGNWKYLIEKLC